MATSRPLSSFLRLVSILCLFSSPASLVSAVKRHYIVYLGGHSHGGFSATEADLHAVTNSHHDLLTTYLGDLEAAKDAIRYSYKRHINGFTAVLDDEEAAQIARHPGVVSVFPDGMKRLHTTNSWDFMLLNKEIGKRKVPNEIWKAAKFGENIIIGNLDSGVWPESKSFSDKGYSTVPSRWKGVCENNTKAGVPCNRKLIGSRLYNRGMLEEGGADIVDPADIYSPRDMDGHGTHTLSTAGGNFVARVDILGSASGVAKGGAPRARVASYKVCFATPDDDTGCSDSDILAGFEDAISDGVDVLSVSLGSDNFTGYTYLADGVAIGSFHAVRSGVVVVASAGNSGPVQGTVSNMAPWIITVGASTTDRNVDVYAELGNGERLKGTAIFEKPLPVGRKYTLASAADVRLRNATAADAILCLPGTLNPKKAKGKILACLRGKNARVDKSLQAGKVGAVGVILCNDVGSGLDLDTDLHSVPTSHVNYRDGLKVFRYINATKNHPTAYLTPSVTTYGNKPAPSLASFSSRGPNVVTPQILKPDVTAPGVDILAAFSMAGHGRKYPYQLDSGTSMSCPHVAGVAALVKAVHPDWSPSAIHSAIMTTATTKGNNGGKMIDEDEKESTSFGYGSGHIRPNRAINPGLVYEVAPREYLEFLCSIGYKSSKIGRLMEKGYKCPKKKVKSVFDHNYPSFSVPNLGSGPVTFKRRVKNVGPPGTYTAEVKEPYGVRVKVVPNVLKFEKYGQKKTFKVKVTAKRKGVAKGYEFGGLTWTDGVHQVRSPIFVTDNLVIDPSSRTVR
ncbi:unnamed protein product [Linum trigynum]|uniref:Subtilisin-like protease n=1 Tax=Linum trigynum TaxID=586398 RepID=A0AAV2C7R5_9ROSI